jgi:sterol desaturase/sphingolipid hydroxylase (fatty acid hydroxylase superfamily)
LNGFIRFAVQIQQRILNFVTRANWVILAGSTAAGTALAPVDFALGILCGGLIVTINFYLLARTLHRALTPPHLASHNAVLAKYYLRFMASAFVIFLLIAGGVVNPLGLVIGLSVVVVSIILATIREVKKIIFKEAV